LWANSATKCRFTAGLPTTGSISRRTAFIVDRFINVQAETEAKEDLISPSSSASVPASTSSMAAGGGEFAFGCG
jgi:hypothetical protein